jgi:hypothetical protein
MRNSRTRHSVVTVDMGVTCTPLNNSSNPAQTFVLPSEKSKVEQDVEYRVSAGLTTAQGVGGGNDEHMWLISRDMMDSVKWLQT